MVDIVPTIGPARQTAGRLRGLGGGEVDLVFLDLKRPVALGGGLAFTRRESGGF